MNHFQEYALLIAVAVPVLALVGLNAFLWFGGERGTLLVPSSMPYAATRTVESASESPVVSASEPIAAPVTVATVSAPAGSTVQAPANEEHALQAA